MLLHYAKRCYCGRMLTGASQHSGRVAEFARQLEVNTGAPSCEPGRGTVRSVLHVWANIDCDVGSKNLGQRATTALRSILGGAKTMQHLEFERVMTVIMKGRSGGVMFSPAVSINSPLVSGMSGESSVSVCVCVLFPV
jgi:hypothetical protein